MGFGPFGVKLNELSDKNFVFFIGQIIKNLLKRLKWLSRSEIMQEFSPLRKTSGSTSFPDVFLCADVDL